MKEAANAPKQQMLKHQIVVDHGCLSARVRSQKFGNLAITVHNLFYVFNSFLRAAGNENSRLPSQFRTPSGSARDRVHQHHRPTMRNRKSRLDSRPTLLARFNNEPFSSCGGFVVL
jgi:hypothetical protein